MTEATVTTDSTEMMVLEKWARGQISTVKAIPTLQRKAGRLVRRAVLLLDEVGWRQNNFGDQEDRLTGRMCMIGAIRCAENRDPFRRSPQTDFTECAFLHWALTTDATDQLSLTGWNDQPHRTKRQVQQLMHQFADAMDPQ